MKTMKKIVYQNKQKYSECQLVSALNAAYHLGEKYIDPDSEEYERLVDLVLARNGSAITIEYAYRYLRLKYGDVKPCWESIEFAMEMKLPVGMGLSTKKYGSHSALIVKKAYDNSRGGYKLKVPNLSHYTNKQMWIHWEEFEKMIYKGNNLGPEYCYFRIFYRNPLFKT